MSKFTELVRFVCADLDRESLLKCALINKQWHEAVMPFLFKDILEPMTLGQKESFRQLILEDYNMKDGLRQEGSRRGKQSHKQKKRPPKRRQKQRAPQNQQEASTTGCSAPKPTVAAKSSDVTQSQAHQSSKGGSMACQQASKSSLSRSAKYGVCVRTIPDIGLLFISLRGTPKPMLSEVLTRMLKMPTEVELLEQFLSRCPNMRIPVVRLSQYHMLDPDLSQLAVKYTVPAAVHLILAHTKRKDDDDDDDDGVDDDSWSYDSEDYYTDDDDTDDQRDTDDDGTTPIVECSHGGHLIQSVFMMKLVLTNTSSNLETLSINMAAPWVTSKIYLCSEHLAGRSDFMSGIKELQIIRAGHELNQDTNACWNWVWKHATTLESLQVADATPDFVTCLERGISTHMHRLDKIHLGRDAFSIHEDRVHLYDPAIARLLKVGPYFKSIYFDISARPKPPSIQSLYRHYSTLTEFTLEISTGVDSCLVQILAFCPNLRKLVAIQYGEYAFINSFMSHAEHKIFPDVDAKVFADLDRATKTYHPWACESTLETLQIKISGIPWYDHDNDDEGSVSRENNEDTYPLQRLVYGRLARLTKLKTLWLGHMPLVAQEWSPYPVLEDSQRECLEMTLASGLAALGTLQKLKHVNLQGMFFYKARFGAGEMQWMVDHWPELERIWVDFGPGREWLQEHHPGLQGQPMDLWNHVSFQLD
ncbi:MAG: hypothetical protein BYD32DRAFT_453113 [Podila humilis]|nr:MAG: hypothetical protein BYD32DRAFT_453113 [Podila humilis]